MTKQFQRSSSFGWLIAVMSNYAIKVFDTELHKHQLTIALWPTLMCLWEEEGLTQRQLADRVKVRSSTTTRTLDKLELMGLVERKTNPESRRSFLIVLTNKGKALKETILPIPIALNKDLLAQLEDSEAQELTRLMKKLVQRIYFE